MAIDVDTLQKLRTDMEVPKLDLSWLDLEEGHPWGLRAKPGKRGLTLDEIEIGAVGEVPEHTRLLYGEAGQRQWSSATDIPWHEIQPLPDDIERAMCQLCTFLTEVEFIAGDTPGQWLPQPH